VPDLALTAAGTAGLTIAIRRRRSAPPGPVSVP
jgi:hypothetical protein